MTAKKKPTETASTASTDWGDDARLSEAVSELTHVHEKHGVEMKGGKKYTMVKDRVEIFRKHFGHNYSIETSLEYADANYVRVKAVVVCHDNPEHPRVVGTGHAEELRGSTNVNKTSALENAETGAIGRALASIGLAGGEYASANEMETVVRNEAVLTQRQARPDNVTFIMPSGEPRELQAEGTETLENLIAVCFEVGMFDCHTNEALNDFIRKNQVPLERLKNSPADYAKYVEAGKAARQKLTEEKQ